MGEGKGEWEGHTAHVHSTCAMNVVHAISCMHRTQAHVRELWLSDVLMQVDTPVDLHPSVGCKCHKNHKTHMQVPQAISMLPKMCCYGDGSV